jgi:hypothetical protein
MGGFQSKERAILCFYYCVYGLQVASSQSLPYLAASLITDQIDVTLDFVGDEPLETPQAQNSLRVWRLHDNSFCFCVTSNSGYTEYVIDPNGSSIRVAWSEHIQLIETLPYLFGTAFGVALRSKGVLCLHGSAVAVDGKALVFLGRSGTGKSTLCAAFTQRGYRSLSEDVIALEEVEDCLCISPGYASVRLHKDAHSIVYAQPATALKPIPSFNKTKQYYEIHNFYSKPCPIRAVYLLGSRRSELESPRITPLEPVSSLLSLMSQLYLKRFEAPHWLARDFPRMAQVAQSIPVRFLERPDDLNKLSHTIDFLLNDTEMLC